MGKYLLQLTVALVFASAVNVCAGSEQTDSVYQRDAYVVEEPIIAAGNDKNFQSVVIVESGMNRRFEPSDAARSKQGDEIFINRPAHRTQTVGHQLFSSHHFDKLMPATANAADSRGPALKTYDVGHQLFGSQQFEKILEVSGIKAPAAALRTNQVGHKLFGDRQFGQLQASADADAEPANESNKMAEESHDGAKAAAAAAAAREIMSDKTNGRINVDKYAEASYPEAPTVEIDAIVEQPGEEPREEVGVPSGRRLVSSKAYELAPSALPLVSGLPHDSAHLQILSEIPHRVYIHPPKVYPVTPSPELSGPLLGGPRLVDQPPVESKPMTGNRHRPYFGRPLGRALGRERAAARMQEEVDPRAGADDSRTFQEYYFQPMMSYPMVRPGFRGNLFPLAERKYNAYYP